VENIEVKKLIETFKEYRDLITPIEQNLREFSLSFTSIQSDIKNLNESFDGGTKNKLDKIYKELASQADKAKTLSSQVDNFLNTTNRYVYAVDNLVGICERIEEKLCHINNIEKQAETQIEKLEIIIEEKKKSYDLKQLERNLENYNVGVQKVSEYINQDVAENLKASSSQILQIKNKNESILSAILDEKDSINKLVENYDESNKLLKKIIESNDVNEAYIFEIIDRWADDRKVRTKK